MLPVPHHCVDGRQRSAVSGQPSAISYQLSAFSGLPPPADSDQRRRAGAEVRHSGRRRVSVNALRFTIYSSLFTIFLLITYHCFRFFSRLITYASSFHHSIIPPKESLRDRSSSLPLPLPLPLLFTVSAEFLNNLSRDPSHESSGCSSKSRLLPCNFSQCVLT